MTQFISQETFDRVAGHLLTQNEVSYAYGNCQYRGPDGLMCAVGCLIKDEHYSERLENLNAGEPIVRDALLKSGIAEGEVEDLLFLQMIHDDYDPQSWRDQLQAFAEEANLKWKFN